MADRYCTKTLVGRAHRHVCIYPDKHIGDHACWCHYEWN